MQTYLNFNFSILKCIVLGAIFAAQTNALTTPLDLNLGGDAQNPDNELSLCRRHDVLHCAKADATIDPISHCLVCPTPQVLNTTSTNSTKSRHHKHKQGKVIVKVLSCPYRDVEGLCPPPNCGSSLGSGFECTDVGSTCIPWKNNNVALTIGTCSPANTLGGIAAVSLNVTSTDT